MPEEPVSEELFTEEPKPVIEEAVPVEEAALVDEESLPEVPAVEGKEKQKCSGF